MIESILLSVFGVLFAVTGIYGLKGSFRFLTQGIKTEATVVSIDQTKDGEGINICYPIVKYINKVGEECIHKVSDSSNIGYWPKKEPYFIGQAVKIRYIYQDDKPTLESRVILNCFLTSYFALFGLLALASGINKLFNLNYLPF